MPQAAWRLASGLTAAGCREGDISLEFVAGAGHSDSEPGTALRGALWNALCGALWKALWRALWKALCHPLCNARCNALRDVMHYVVHYVMHNVMHYVMPYVIQAWSMPWSVPRTSFATSLCKCVHTSTHLGGLRWIHVVVHGECAGCMCACRFCLA